MNRPVQPRPLVLASTSPRRRELLEEQGYEFEVVSPRFEEPNEQRPNVPARHFAESLAFFKAVSIAERNPNKTILGADTIAFIEGRIIGKPKDREDARRILKLLSNTNHEVITGVALINSASERRLIEFDVSVIRVRQLTDPMIDAYLDTGLWQGKAGAYGIQDKNDPFVEKVEGSLSNVMGLPMELIGRMFATWNSNTRA
jgi:septum formation protein